MRALILLSIVLLLGSCARGEAKIDLLKRSKPYPEMPGGCLQRTVLPEVGIAPDEELESENSRDFERHCSVGWKGWSDWLNEGAPSRPVQFIHLLRHRYRLQVWHNFDQCQPTQPHRVEAVVSIDGYLSDTLRVTETAAACNNSLLWEGVPGAGFGWIRAELSAEKLPCPPPLPTRIERVRWLRDEVSRAGVLKLAIGVEGEHSIPSPEGGY